MRLYAWDWLSQVQKSRCRWLVTDSGPEPNIFSARVPHTSDLCSLPALMMFGNSFRHSSEATFDATHGVGLIIASLSISLDSLGIGIALPALGIPLRQLLVTVSITTTVFTSIGLSFGARLGERYERNAERAAGVILVVLAVLFAIEHTRSHF